eukprot:3483013-Prymnesium_polylepis.1
MRRTQSLELVEVVPAAQRFWEGGWVLVPVGGGCRRDLGLSDCEVGRRLLPSHVVQQRFVSTASSRASPFTHRARRREARCLLLVPCLVVEAVPISQLALPRPGRVVQDACCPLRLPVGVVSRLDSAARDRAVVPLVHLRPVD